MTELEFEKLYRILMGDKRLFTLGLSDGERGLVQAALISVALDFDHDPLSRKLARDVREMAKHWQDKLPLARLWQVIATLQQRPMDAVLVGIAFKLSDLVLARHPELQGSLESGWKVELPETFQGKYETEGLKA